MHAGCHVTYRRKVYLSEGFSLFLYLQLIVLEAQRKFRVISTTY